MNHDVVIVGGSYPSVKWIDGAVMEVYFTEFVIQ